MERRFKRHLSSLDSVFDFVSEVLVASDIHRSVAFPINLAIEELFTNMVKYNRGSASEITIVIQPGGNGVKVTIVDHADAPFDVTKITPVDVRQPLEKRRPGGLGLHLIQHMVDELRYEYANGESKVMFSKNVE